MNIEEDLRWIKVVVEIKDMIYEGIEDGKDVDVVIVVIIQVIVE